MAKRNFVKAYNDIITGPTGQSTASVFNGFTKLARHGTRNEPTMPKSLRKVPSFKLPKKPSSSRGVYKPKQSRPIPLAENVSTSSGWSQMKRTDRENFIDLDAENIALSEGAKCPVHSHKVFNHTAKKVSQLNLSQSDPNRARAVNKKDVKNEMDPKSFHRGINPDQPYVTPKFTPNFREMAKGREKLDPLVSIMEATPPSMQKWAIEWNSDPKNTISIAELKDDIRRQQAAGGLSTCGLYSEENWAVEPNPPLLKKVEPERSDAVRTARELSSDETEPNKERHQPAGLDRFNNVSLLKRWESDQTSSFQENTQTDTARRPPIYERAKGFRNGLPQQIKYSFKKTIECGTLEPERGNRHFDAPSDAEKTMIYQSLSKRYSRKTDEYQPTEISHNKKAGREDSRETYTYSIDAGPTSEEPKYTEKTIMEATKNAVPEEQPKKTQPAAQVFPEVRENSSFYHWLKRRGFPSSESVANRISNSVNDELTAKTDREPQTTESPTLRSIINSRKHHSQTNRQTSDRETAKSLGASENLGVASESDTVHATKSQMSFHRTTGTRKRNKSQEAVSNSNRAQKKNADTGNAALGQLAGVACQGRTSGNETDHVENLRRFQREGEYMHPLEEDEQIPLDSESAKCSMYSVNRGKNGEFSLIERDSVSNVFASNESAVRRQIDSKRTNNRSSRNSTPSRSGMEPGNLSGSSRNQTARGKSMYIEKPSLTPPTDELLDHQDLMYEYDDCWLKGDDKGYLGAAFDAVTHDEDQGWSETIGPKSSLMRQSC